MKCTEIDHLTDDFINGELTRSAQEAFTAHINGCPHCKRKTSVVEGLISTIQELPHALPPEALVRKTRESIYSYHEPRLASFFGFWADHSRGIINFGFAVALLVLLGLNLNLYFAQRNLYQAYAPRAGTETGNLQQVRFVLDASLNKQFQQASSIAVVGDFNGWDPASNKMRYDNNQGTWVLDLRLKSGVYDYMYVINDKIWIPDPQAEKVRDDGFGGKNSILKL